MPNQKTIYKNGRLKEYAVIRELRREGFELAQRSAGSRSPVDVWAVNTKTKEIKLVQVKSQLKESERDKLMLDNHKLNGTFKVSFEVWN